MTDLPEALRLSATASEQPASREVYVVEVFNREDGIYLFEREEDAAAFEEAVNGTDDTTFGSRCFRQATPVNSAEAAAHLIKAEKESWQ